jgi:hypothetical protein
MASMITILQLTSTVVGHLNDVKDAPKDHARCATEALHLFNLLNHLKYRLDEADTNQSWYTAVRALAVKDGPFDQYKSALEQLHRSLVISFVAPHKLMILDDAIDGDWIIVNTKTDY